MDLLSQLQNDMKLAMKSGQKDRLGVIRMLISDVKVIDLNPAKPTAEQVVESYGKKLRKTIEEYQKLNKPDEVTKLLFELGVVEEYLPKRASPGDTEALVEKFLAANSFTEKQMGQAMGAFMKAHGSEVDPATAKTALQKRLVGK